MLFRKTAQIMRDIILKLPLINLAYWWNPEWDNWKSHVIILNNAALDFLIGKIKKSGNFKKSQT